MSDQDTTRGRKLNYINENLWDKEPRGRNLERNIQLPVKISGSLTAEQIAAYQTMFRIQEITSTLRSNVFDPPSRKNRSPSPPPAYDARGKRINTREQRYRRKLEEERHRLVEIALKMIPHFVAPEGYKRPVKFQDKYYIPVDSYPEINFVGLLLGPRGNTLKKLQEDSGCKIAIRGRGSVKEGKNANDLPRGAMNFSDPLHCLIIADTEDKIQKGIKACENIICKAVTSPEGQNDLKRGQLRELAELNGTLREDNRPCPICGLQGHKRYECPNKETFAQRITCRRCGQQGHATIDCMVTMQGSPSQESRYEGYMGGDANYAPPWQEQQAPWGDHQQPVGVSSYRSRQARGVFEPQTASYHAPQITQAVPGNSRQVYDQVLSPPGLDESRSTQSGWGIPGMSSASLPAVPSVESSNMEAPPGMEPSATNELPSLESLPTLPGLSGPPGLPGTQTGSQSDMTIEGPPGL